MRTHYDVIVVGAGLAGLTSAYELSSAGHKVLLLEAQKHPGGRVKTLRVEFSHRLFADAGAHFIPDRHKLVLSYAKQFRLPVVPLPDKGIRYHLLGMNEGVLIEFGKSWPSPIPLALTDDERKLGLSGIMEAYLGPAMMELGDPTSPDWPPPPLKKYDHVSFLQFLKNRPSPPSEGAIDLIRPFLWWGSREDLDSISALSVLCQQAIGFASDRHVYAIKEGMDALPKAFANCLAGKISHNSAVVAIRQGARSVTITYRRSGKKHTLSADRVICAIPFSTLRDITIEPRLDSQKREAVEQLSCTSVARVFLQCAQRAWPVNGATFTDLPAQNFLEPTLVQRGTRKILESYISGMHAKTISQLDKRDRIPFVLGQAQLVYPDIVKSFERGAHVCWDEDPWSGGAYSFFKPGEMFKFSQELLARPDGRVHFAGDHTSSRPGWMEGAIESGRRAAHEVFDALKSQR